MFLKNTPQNQRYPQAGIMLSMILLLLNRPLLAQLMPDSDPKPLDRAPLSTFEENEPIQILPPSPEPPMMPQEDMPSSAVIHTKVKQFKFEGNHVFSDEELAKITKPYENVDITTKQLQDVKNKITLYYVNKGYINSGAIFPDQNILNGIVIIKIIEGKLSKVEVSGNEKLRASYLQKRLKGKEGAVLNIDELQERLQMLQQNPLLERLQTQLGPGTQLGESILKIEVDEARPYQLKFNFNNHRSPTVGAYRGEIEGWHRNFTGLLFGKGWGDTLYLRYGLTKGLNDYTLRYSLPLNRYDTTLSFEIERSDSEIVESPFKQLDIESEADTYAITLNHSLQGFKKPNQSLDLTLKLEKRTSQTFLLGNPFSFSAGVKNGKSDISVIRFSQDWLNRSRQHVLAARSTFNLGIDALDSSINEDGSPDSKFFSWLGQFQYIRRLDFLKNKFLKQSKILFRTDFQWTNQGLLPLEKLSLGGASTVRGYRENFLTRDKAIISSLEWRIPIRPIVGLKQNPEHSLLELACFVDYGHAWEADFDTPDPKNIYSVGLGLRWRPNQYFHTQLYWGHALRDIPEPDDKDLQDDGIHFEMSVLF